MPGFSAEAKVIIRERATLLGETEPRCELPSCRGREHDRPGDPRRRFVFHHKRLKGQGGTADPMSDHPDNGALLHDGCHVDGVHGQPQQARALGLIVSRHQQVREWRPEGVGA